MESSKDESYKYSRKFCLYTGNGYHLFFIHENGHLMGMGRNTEGQLAVGQMKIKKPGVYQEINYEFATNENLSSQFVDREPVKIPFFERNTKREVKDVCLGEFHSIFITARNEGSNEFDQLSQGKDTEVKRFWAKRGILTNVSLARFPSRFLHHGYFTPLKVKKSEDEDGAWKERIVKAYSAYSTSFFITRSGRVLAYWGQCGRGKRCLSFTTAGAIPNLYNIDSIAGGLTVPIKGPSVYNVLRGGTVVGEYTIFLSRRGHIFTCGCYVFGQDRTLYRPCRVRYFRKMGIRVTRILPTTQTTYFVSKTRQVYVCGGNKFGEYGNGKFEHQSRLPILTPALSNFSLICNGACENFLIHKKHGKLFRTGLLPYTRLIKPQSGETVKDWACCTPREIPTDLAGHVQEIFTARTQTFVVTDDGTCWFLRSQAIQIRKGENFKVEFSGLRIRRKGLDRAGKRALRFKFLRQKIGMFRLDGAGITSVFWGRDADFDRLDSSSSVAEV